MFKKLFKPSWQSAKPQVRVKAIEQLHLSDEKERKIIEQLAKNDVVAEVRLAAIARLDEKSFLTKLILQEREPSVRLAIIEKLVQLSNSEIELDPMISDLVISMDTPVLMEVAAKTRHLKLGLLAIEQIDDQAVLADQALSLPVAALRQKAAEHVSDIAYLETIQKTAKGKDKSVFRIARTKLQAIHDAQQQEASQEQQLNEVCLQMEQLARSNQDPMFESRVAYWHKQWNSLQTHANADDRLRFNRAFDLCRDSLQESQQQQTEQQAAQHEQRQSLQEALQERMAACEQLESVIAQIKAMDADAIGGKDVSAFLSIQKIQLNRWESATEESSPAQDERKRFNRADTLLNKMLLAMQLFNQQQSALEHASKALLVVSDPDANQLDKLRQSLEQAVGALEWPRELSKPNLLKQVEQAQARCKTFAEQARQKQSQANQHIEKLLEELDTAIKAGQLKQSHSLLNDAQKWLKYVPAKNAADSQKLIRAMAARVNELQDWQGFAINPKKEQLCTSMEALVVADMDAQERINRIKRLQDEWKTLGHSKESQALWQRFSAAADKAYDLCREFIDNLAEVRNRNLEQRKNIVAQLQEYLENYNFAVADWRAVNEIYEAAKQEWRLYNPVERKQGKKLQEQFNALLDTLQQRLHAEWQANKEHREVLISQAESLLDEPALNKAIEASKQLQRQWKDAGMVSKRDEHRLWRRFRSANDKVFARRDSERQAAQNERQHNFKEACHLIELIDRLVDADLDWQQAKHEFQQLQQRFAALGALPKEDAERIQKEYKTVCRHFAEAVEQAQASARQQLLLKLWDWLCETDALEEQILNQQTVTLQSPELDQFAGFPWAQQVMEQRYQGLQRIHQEPVCEPHVIADNANKLRDLCLRFEIIAGLDSPPEDQKQRMALQIARLEGGLQQRDKAGSQVAQINQLLLDWAGVAPVESSVRSALSQRFGENLRQLD